MRTAVFLALVAGGVFALMEARSQTVALDLSTPEKAVRSFVAAIKAPDLPLAVKAIAGAKPHPYIDQLQADIQRDKKNNLPNINITDIQVQTTGDTATATVTFAPPVERGMASPETVKLRKEGEEWKVAPFDSAEMAALPRNEPKEMPIITMMASALAYPNVLLTARDTARGVSCLSNVKQLALGTMMYMQDYDEVFPRRGTSYKQLIMPYIKNQSVFTCPSDKAGTLSYTLNQQLLGVGAAKIGRPAETVLIYEGSQGKLDFKHDGKAAVAFADGHAKMLDAAAAKTLRWAPGPVPAKSFKPAKAGRRKR